MVWYSWLKASAGDIGDGIMCRWLILSVYARFNEAPQMFIYQFIKYTNYKYIYKYIISIMLIGAAVRHAIAR